LIKLINTIFSLTISRAGDYWCRKFWNQKLKIKKKGVIMEGEIDKVTEIDNFVSDLIESRSLDKSKIIIILQDIQEKFGYLSQESIKSISRHLRIPAVDIFGIATFYAQFRFNKPGRHQIKVCEGTACHVRGSKDIVSTIERELNISHNQTTADGMFSMERVACLGCCALAPVIVIDEEIHGQMSTSGVKPLLNKYRENPDKPEKSDPEIIMGGS
jgi:NADH-quinone oxidoreductase subunit E